MKKYFFALLIASFAYLGLSTAQEEEQAPPMHKPMEHMGDRLPFLAKLKLTDAQKEQMKNLKFESTKKEIDLRSKLAHSKLELGHLLASDAPDKAAIEKQLNEVSANETALKMNKLNGWFEANTFLTPEQQKIWRQFLRAEVMKVAARERHEEMEEGHRP